MRAFQAVFSISLVAAGANSPAIAFEAAPAQPAPAFVDAAVASFPDGAPPPTQCSSVLDFRQPDHVASRVSRFHGAARAGGASVFQAAMYDGACRGFGDVPDSFATALP